MTVRRPADSLFSTALRMQARREHSQAELRRKLAARSEAGEDAGAEIEQVIERLGEVGLQSDERFAESFVRARAARHGAARIRRELAERGVAADLAQTVLAETLEEDELVRARGVWMKKFGTPPEEAREWARQARFMMTRGFSMDVIRKLLKEPFDESAPGF